MPKPLPARVVSALQALRGLGLMSLPLWMLQEQMNSRLQGKPDRKN